MMNLHNLKSDKDENGKFRLTKESEYYNQVQGQMGIYGYHLADLVIYAKLGIHVIEEIDFVLNN